MALQPNQVPENSSDRRRPHLMEVTNGPPPPDSLGALLRGTRLRANQDIKTASKVTKIKPEYLEALEEDRIDSLPGRTYAIGFLRTYADFLGLDSAACVARLKAEHPVEQPAEAGGQVGLPEIKDEVRIPQGTLIIVGVLVLAAIYGGVYLFRSANQYMEQRAHPAPTAPIEPLGPATPNPTSDASPGASAAPAESSETPAPSAQAPSFVPPAFVTPTVAPPPAEKPSAEAPPKPTPAPKLKDQAKGKTSAQTETENDDTAAEPPTPIGGSQGAASAVNDSAASATGSSAEAGQPAPAMEGAAASPTYVQALAAAPRTFGVTDKSNRVVLRASNKVFVRVETQGSHHQVLFEGTLNPGELYFVPAVPDAVLVTPDGGALGVYVDGAPKGTAGPAGIALKDMRLDPESLENR